MLAVSAVPIDSSLPNGHAENGVVSQQDMAWFHSYFHAQSANKSDFEWQAYVTDLMTARHRGAFVQVDPTGRGDKGCDGWVDNLMLACYGAIKNDPKALARKIKGDFANACTHWESSMRRWAFVHNNKRGLAEVAHREIIALRVKRAEHGVDVETWPPDLLWDETGAQLGREQLVRIIGAPPSDNPAGISYIGKCVEALARLPIPPEEGHVPPVEFGKVEENKFGDDVSSILIYHLNYTARVRQYFKRARPGEQAQAAENIRIRYEAARARYHEPDTTFHALCEDLRREAFGLQAPSDAEEIEEQRSAVLMVVTHYFEKCTIFEPVKATRR